MPAQTQKVTIVGKFGNRAKEAAAKHAKDPVRIGRQQLPPWINNGIATLLKIDVKQYDASTPVKQGDGSSATGQLYVTFTGSVESPKVHQANGTQIGIEGVQFYETIPLCDKGCSYKGQMLSFEELQAEIQNMIRAIAGEDFDTTDIDKAIDIVNGLKPKLRFKFSTTESKEDPNRKDPRTGKPYPPRTWVNWLGAQGLGSAETSNADGVVGDDVANSNGHATNDTAVGSGAPDDLDALLAAADVEDDETPAMEARRKLKELAETAGMSKAEYDAAGWPDVVSWLKANASNKDGTAGGDDGGDFLPKVGEMYKYSYRDASGKVLKDLKTKKDKKPVQVEVLSVDEAKKTVTLKDMDTGKTIVGGNKRAIAIPFDHLEGD